jgi:hypothetical protein
MISDWEYVAIVDYCKRIVKRAKSNLRRKKKLATGVLYDSITYTIDRKTGNFQFEYAAHGEFVEKGRRRGAKMPPIKPIEKWIKSRGLDLNAFAVAKSIQKKGIKPYPFITNEVDKSINELAYLLEEAVAKQIESDWNQIN